MSGVVVLGVGNLLMGDEGLGIRCVEAIEKLATEDPGIGILVLAAGLGEVRP